MKIGQLTGKTLKTRIGFQCLKLGLCLRGLLLQLNNGVYVCPIQKLRDTKKLIL